MLPILQLTDFTGQYRLNLNLDNNTLINIITEVETRFWLEHFDRGFVNNFILPAAPNSFINNLNNTLYLNVRYRDFMRAYVLQAADLGIYPSGQPAPKEFIRPLFFGASLGRIFLDQMSIINSYHRVLITDAGGVGRHIVAEYPYLSGYYPVYPIPEGAVFTDGVNNYTIATVITGPVTQYVFAPPAPPNTQLTNASYRYLLVWKSKFVFF